MGCGWSSLDDMDTSISSEHHAPVITTVTEQDGDIEMTDRERVEKWLNNSGVTFTVDGIPSNYTKLRRDSFSN